MGRLFGTDGVRGVANQELTPELAFRVGRAAAAVLAGASEHMGTLVNGRRPRVLVGRDTRVSGPMLQSALMAGLMSGGVDCLDAGIVPTPGVAYLTRLRGAQAGVVVSASHNPVADNGIKFFSADGYKLPDPLEEEIERLVTEMEAGQDHLPRPIEGAVGHWFEDRPALRDYADFLISTAPTRLDGLRVVVDTAFGASLQVAPRVFSRLGAQVVALHLSPNGTNINVGCGSTHPEACAQAVLREKAAAGLAFDGDADRLIAVDERGNVVDGDHILAICGLDRLRRQALPGRKVVATVYSNLGLRQALQREGGDLVISGTGDRQVLETLQAEKLVLGGEQSGHIIFLDHHTTGDGILTALQLLGVMQRTGRPLSELAAQMPVFPQKLANVRVRSKQGWDERPAVQEALATARSLLGDEGELLVRPSGTEPMIRVMAQGPDQAAVEEAVSHVVSVLQAELGLQ
ncbi:MAG: phosphoglucosamine mutase [Limnochordaceae bacterium]|nr:phosphoglucosamine mutase [Limnochordaceae bacterium]